jgi:hypothetical protein
MQVELKRAGGSQRAADSSQLHLLGYSKCIVNFDAEIADGALQFCVTEKKSRFGAASTRLSF